MQSKEQHEELMILLDRKIESHLHLITEMTPEKENPSVKDTFYKACGRLDALLAYREYLQGNTYALRNM